MTDDFSEEKRDFDFEKIEVEAYQKRISEMIGITVLSIYCLLLFVGYAWWIFTGDIEVFIRTSVLALVGFFVILHLLSRKAYIEQPAQPLPDHPDMIPEDEL